MVRFVLLLFLSLLLPAVTSAQEPLYIVIRIDDVQSRSNITPSSLRPFEEAVEARGGKITYAVIPHRLVEPRNADGALAAALKDAAGRGHEIAQHGYNHICPRCEQTSHEMWCATDEESFTYAEQLRLIRDGRALIQTHTGVSPGSFVPPGHATDATTFTVLAQESFKVVSTIEANDLPEGLVNLPPTKEYTWALEPAAFEARLAGALADIRAADGYFNLLLHDPFTRPGYEDGLVIRWIGALLDSVNVAYGDRVRYVTLSGAAAAIAAEVVDAETPPLPSDSALRLDPPYPNPTRDLTHIHFVLPVPGHVELVLYDMLGRTTAVLDIGRRGAGYHTVDWDASAVPAGPYLLRLHHSGQTASQSVVVAR